MTISDAVGALAGRPDRVAVRGTGEVIRLTNRFALQRLYPGGWLQWAIKASDVLADDWMVYTEQQLEQMRAKMTQGNQS